MKVTVQICTYNRKDLLKKCLEKIFFQTFPYSDYEIVLVDDGSTDGTREMVEQLIPPCKFKYIYQKNSGLAKARNTGINKSSGSIILFIDDDILASAELIEEHYNFHQMHPKSVVKGWVNHIGSLKDIKEPKFKWADFSTAFFWTSNVSVEKKYIVEAGGFEEDFTEYGWEDLELGLRLKRLRLKSYFNKKAVVYHYKKEFTKEAVENSIEIARAKGRTAVIFCKKDPSLRVKIATGNHFLRFLLNDILYLFGRGKSFFEKIVGSRNGKLEGFSLFCARRLIDFEYFKALREKNKNKKGHGPRVKY